MFAEVITGFWFQHMTMNSTFYSYEFSILSYFQQVIPLGSGTFIYSRLHHFIASIYHVLATATFRGAEASNYKPLRKQRVWSLEPAWTNSPVQWLHRGGLKLAKMRAFTQQKPTNALNPGSFLFPLESRLLNIAPTHNWLSYCERAERILDTSQKTWVLTSWCY